ncbi:MAG: HYR domain-containing protein [Terriglobales bacterium]
MRWTQTVGGTIAGFSLDMLKSGEQASFVTAQDGYLTRINDDGTKAWSSSTKRFSCPLGDQITTPPTVQLWDLSNAAFRNASNDDLVFVITHTGCGDTTSNRVYAFRASDGTQQWVFNQDGAYQMDFARESCALDYATNTLYCGTNLCTDCSQDTLWAIDSRDGTLKWSRAYGSIRARPAIGYGGKRLYVASFAGTLRALDISTGDPIWSFLVSASAFLITNPWVDSRPEGDHWVILTTSDGSLHVLKDAGNAAERAGEAIKVGLGIGFTTAPVFSRSTGKIYAGVSDNTVREFDVTTVAATDAVATLADVAPFVVSFDRKVTGGPIRDLWVNYIDGVDQGRADRFCVPWSNSAFQRDLSLTMTGPATAQVGQPFSYTLTVTNKGPDTATGVRLSDGLPDLLTFSSAEVSQGSYQETTANLGDLAANSTATFKITVNPNNPGTVENVGTAQAEEQDPAGQNNLDCVPTTISGADTKAPALKVPPDITAEATGPAGAAVSFSVSATDNLDPNPRLICGPASGSTFPLGFTTVSCTATDADANIGNASFFVRVVDTTPPTLTVPADITVPATITAGAVVTFSVSATDLADPQPTILCNPPSGSIFPIGTTFVSCEARDAAGNHFGRAFRVTVGGASEQILTLMEVVIGFKLDPQTTQSLNTKLRNSVTAIDAGDVVTACESMKAFKNEVRAKSGKKIAVVKASQLLSKGEQITTVMACP